MLVSAPEEVVVLAESGVIRIEVENPPEGTYYIALLEKNQNTEGTLPSFESERQTYAKKSEEEQEILDFLFSFSYDGYIFHTTPVGSNCFQSNERHTYKFYYSVPKDFRVILISVDGPIYISEAVNRNHFNSECTFDAATGKLTEKPWSVSHYLFSVVGCFLVTFVIELVVMLFFTLSIKRNFIRFLVTNIVTQILLNGSMFILDQAGIYGNAQLVMWLFIEVVIIVIEIVSYCSHFKTKYNEVHKSINVGYAICANVLSLLAEIPILLLATNIA